MGKRFGHWWARVGLGSGSGLALLMILGAGCSPTTSRLRARFAKEHACPESQVQVTPRGGVVYRAEGCGSETEYVCESFANMNKGGACEERGLLRNAAPLERSHALPRATDNELAPTDSPR